MNPLEHDNNFLQPLIDTIPLITFILDPKGRIYLLNQVACNFITITDESYDYRNKFGGEVFGCIHAQDDPKGCTFGPLCNDCKPFIVALAALKGKTITKASCRYYSRDVDGTRMLYLSISARPIQYLGETYAIVVIEDVTESEKLEAELLKKEKLELLGALSGGIAHDFNNSLMTILANVQLALLKLDKGANIKKHLLDSIEMIYNASNLTKQLLTFSKGGAPVKTFASITNIIKDNVQFVLQGSKIKCRFIIAPNLWTVEIDPGQISQVINNLVINAKQAMPEGGYIDVTAKNTTLNSGDNYKPGQYVMINIQDYGVGIPKANLAKIFDPFFTTKPEGTGLGLATSYSIIKKHDGYLEVDSNEGTGSIFTIYLPAAITSNNYDEYRSEPTPVSEGLKLLLMDDEAMVRNIVGEMLRISGYRTTTVKDGHEAIKAFRLAKETGEPFDIVIMNYAIPGSMGGEETITYLRAIDPDVKAIVSSGYTNDPVLTDYPEYGFQGAVVKPYHFDELNEAISKIIEQ